MLEDVLGSVTCSGCGRIENALDIAWLTIYIAAGPFEVSVSVCGDCQRTAHLTEEVLLTAVERDVREKLRFMVGDAMMRQGR